MSNTNGSNGVTWTVRECKNEGKSVRVRDYPFPSKRLAFLHALGVRANSSGYLGRLVDGNGYIVFAPNR